jgi:hypothetical protein
MVTAAGRGLSCPHAIWTLRPGGLESCAACGEPMGVLHQERGPKPDLVIYDEEAPDVDQSGRGVSRSTDAERTMEPCPTTYDPEPSLPPSEGAPAPSKSSTTAAESPPSAKTAPSTAGPTGSSPTPDLSGRVQSVEITGQTAEWCRNWATFLDRQADENAEKGRALLDSAERGHAEAQAYRDYADLACNHCDKTPERDGDHTCPCPHRDEECPDHPLIAPARGK